MRRRCCPECVTVYSTGSVCSVIQKLLFFFHSGLWGGKLHDAEISLFCRTKERGHVSFPNGFNE